MKIWGHECYEYTKFNIQATILLSILLGLETATLIFQTSYSNSWIFNQIPIHFNLNPKNHELKKNLSFFKYV